MRNCLIILATILLFSSCMTGQKVTEMQRDTLIQVVHHYDSIFMRYQETIYDSVYVHDSVIIIKTEQGGILSYEKYHTEDSDSNRDQVTQETKEIVSDSIRATSVTTKEEVYVAPERNLFNFKFGMLLGATLAMMLAYAILKIFK